MSLYNRKTLGGNTNMNATYYAFHIRRGDFQVKADESLNGFYFFLCKVRCVIISLTVQRNETFCGEDLGQC